MHNTYLKMSKLNYSSSQIGEWSCIKIIWGYGTVTEKSKIYICFVYKGILSAQRKKNTRNKVLSYRGKKITKKDKEKNK